MSRKSQYRLNHVAAPAGAGTPASVDPSAGAGRSTTSTHSTAIAEAVDVPAEHAPRVEEREGEEYLVAPAVAAREMVYSYMTVNGPVEEYLPAEELRASLEEWDGVTMVLNHPSTPEGMPTGIDDPAADPATINPLGAFRNPRIITTNDPDTAGGVGAKLVGEAWLRTDLRGAFGGEYERVLEALSDGGLVDVSTGYQQTPEPEGGRFAGQSYDAVQRDLDPDHVAVLPTEAGNCSLADGCGVGRANTRRLNVRDTARTPTYSGTSSGEWSRPSLSEMVSAFGTDDDGSSVEELSQDTRSAIAERSLLGEASADTEDDLMFFPVVGPDDDLYEAALDAVIGGRGSQADISESQLESARDRAYSLLAEEFDRDVDRENTMESTNTDTEHPPTTTPTGTDPIRQALDTIYRAIARGRHNQSLDDKVRWTDDNGTTHYGIVVDLLEDDADEGVILVAEYVPDEDGEWSATGQEHTIREDSIDEVIEQWPAADQAEADVSANTSNTSTNTNTTLSTTSTSTSSSSSSGAGSGECGCGCDSGTACDQSDAKTTTQNMTDINIEELEENSPFSAETLRAMDDDELSAVAETYSDPDSAGQTADDRDTEDPEHDEPPKDPSDPAGDHPDAHDEDADPASGSESESESEERTNAEIAALREEITELKDRLEAPEREAKNEAIETVVANSDDYSREELEAAPDTLVHKLAREHGHGPAQAPSGGPRANMAGIPSRVDRSSSDADEYPSGTYGEWLEANGGD